MRRAGQRKWLEYGGIPSWQLRIYKVSAEILACGKLEKNTRHLNRALAKSRAPQEAQIVIQGLIAPYGI